jgi:hypothetical protein
MHKKDGHINVGISIRGYCYNLGATCSWKDFDLDELVLYRLISDNRYQCIMWIFYKTEQGKNTRSIMIRYVRSLSMTIIHENHPDGDIG